MDRDIAGDLRPFSTDPAEAERVVEERVGPKLCPSCDQPYDCESWCPERLHRWRESLKKSEEQG